MDSDWVRLAALPLPAMALLSDGRFVVAAKADADKILIQDPREARPIIQSREQFEPLWTGRLIFLAKRAHLRPEDRKFDFTWFIPAIVKYRRMLGEVMLASFFLQMFAILTPLFTQVLIDKVLVHKGLTTLHVLAVGMITLAIFDVTLGALRTYLFSHTTNRIDVGLGAHLFRHVLTLPLTYFEARRVGDTVARVRELETVRHFLTSSTVTVVIDLFFAVVFLGLLLVYSPLLTLVVIGSLPLYAGISFFVTPLVRARLNESSTAARRTRRFWSKPSRAFKPSRRWRWSPRSSGDGRSNWPPTCGPASARRTSPTSAGRPRPSCTRRPPSPFSGSARNWSFPVISASASSLRST